jgi:hypothetical protein
MLTPTTSTYSIMPLTNILFKSLMAAFLAILTLATPVNLPPRDPAGSTCTSKALTEPSSLATIVDCAIS